MKEFSFASFLGCRSEREFKEGIQCWVSLGRGVWMWAELSHAFLVTDSVTQAAQELPQRQQRFSDFTVKKKCYIRSDKLCYGISYHISSYQLI